MEAIPEENIETFCTEGTLKAVIQAIRESHPYEEPAITSRSRLFDEFVYFLRAAQLGFEPR